MRIYLAGPNTQQQAEHAANMPVLLSFAYYKKWIDQYQPSFSRLLIDSGAFSELNSGQKIDLVEYRDWSQKWIAHADAIAGLDDIAGDYHRSLRNYGQIDWAFPTWHDTDPLELLPELVAMARERGNWIGIGMKPPRHGKERIIRQALDQIPDDLHVHGWALCAYSRLRRFDSFDSTNWWRDAMKLRTIPLLDHLTYGECLDIIVKKYSRWERSTTTPETEQVGLFDQTQN